MTLLHKERGEILLENLKIASSFWQRFRGLMGRRELETGEGLYLSPCNSIHCFFMKFPIDVVFVDQAGAVLGVFPRKAPWSIIMPVKGAKAAIEAAAGTLEHKVKKGDILLLEEAIR